MNIRRPLEYTSIIYGYMQNCSYQKQVSIK